MVVSQETGLMMHLPLSVCQDPPEAYEWKENGERAGILEDPELFHLHDFPATAEFFRLLYEHAAAIPLSQAKSPRIGHPANFLSDMMKK
jgi:hypothetical protein